jgi:hypothetical protein
MAAARLRLGELEQAGIRNHTQGMGITTGTSNGGQGPRGDFDGVDQRIDDPNAQWRAE